MSPRWLNFDYVPSELRFSRKQRQEAWRLAMRLPGAKVTMFFGGLTAALGWMVPTIGIMYLFGDWALNSLITPGPGGGLSSGMVIVSMILPLSGFVVSLAMMKLMTWWLWRPYIYRALNGMGHSICPHCSYLCSGLPDDADRCPECGRIFKPQECPACRLPTGALPGMVLSCPRCSSALVAANRALIARRLRTSVAEPALEKTNELRAIRETIWGPARIRRWALIVGTVLLVVGLPGWVYLLMVQLDSGTNRYFIALIGSLNIVSFSVLILYLRLYVMPMREALLDHGYKLCRACGYQFQEADRALARCPDCGMERGRSA